LELARAAEGHRRDTARAIEREGLPLLRRRNPSAERAHADPLAFTGSAARFVASPQEGRILGLPRRQPPAPSGGGAHAAHASRATGSLLPGKPAARGSVAGPAFRSARAPVPGPAQLRRSPAGRPRGPPRAGPPLPAHPHRDLDLRGPGPPG